MSVENITNDDHRSGLWDTLDRKINEINEELSPEGITASTSRALTDADNGKVIECTTTITLTVPAGLVSGFACAIIPSGTTSIASSGGALINGATDTLTRADSSNTMFAIQARSSVANSYIVTGL